MKEDDGEEQMKAVGREEVRDREKQMNKEGREEVRDRRNK